MVNGIQPFLVDLPSEITNGVAEVVLLKPLKADFLVDTNGENCPFANLGNLPAAANHRASRPLPPRRSGRCAR